MSYSKTVDVGIEPIVDKNDIILGYRLLEPLRRPCVTCGHEADYRHDTWTIPQSLFDRWVHLESEMAQVNDQLTQIYKPTNPKRMYNVTTSRRSSY